MRRGGGSGGSSAAQGDDGSDGHGVHDSGGGDGDGGGGGGGVRCAVTLIGGVLSLAAVAALIASGRDWDGLGASPLSESPPPQLPYSPPTTAHPPAAANAAAVDAVADVSSTAALEPASSALIASRSGGEGDADGGGDGGSAGDGEAVVEEKVCPPFCAGRPATDEVRARSRARSRAARAPTVVARADRAALGGNLIAMCSDTCLSPPRATHPPRWTPPCCVVVAFAVSGGADRRAPRAHARASASATRALGFRRARAVASRAPPRRRR